MNITSTNLSMPRVAPRKVESPTHETAPKETFSFDSRSDRSLAFELVDGAVMGAIYGLVGAESYGEAMRFGAAVDGAMGLYDGAVKGANEAGFEGAVAGGLAHGAVGAVTGALEGFTYQAWGQAFGGSMASYVLGGIAIKGMTAVVSELLADKSK